MAETVVTLSQKYEAHGRTFDAVRLREPTGADLDAIGEIAELQYSANGSALIIYHDDRVQAYRARLLVHGEHEPSDGDLAQIALVDSLAIRDAIRDFFHNARRALSERHKTD